MYLSSDLEIILQRYLIFLVLGDLRFLGIEYK